ncbi:helix-turn-helix transcriptional regulator [Undibacterium sp. RTI2.1]|uniref:helix-turn-helix transcriptional regulator n=1 Tax=unclassified Undibacterium TaxID=2630295 RepID=UPI002AB489C2|nr:MULTISPECIES: helix-turn-helix transcriptional regulator [unclassified Undibacterium]MDY7537693.1 helix-turn-helix transcriptional regulator [Undibacterium sp. 5I1]MEB0029295.1 helix-turn-helix transcriptional regulator [Undibacterium sp. RTI2.1]MEB0115603.1 helix-turn-helix transcriptional regulator [Undibacterium sp. RTI2.2]MEB0256430.1 helix-turn-helix transcriptional regulator [Undibacterium sp. 5I1]
MTIDDLRGWQSQMGYTQAQAAETLGVGLSAYKDWINGMSRTTGKPVSIDKRTGLACAALVANLSEYSKNPVN